MSLAVDGVMVECDDGVDDADVDESDNDEVDDVDDGDDVEGGVARGRWREERREAVVSICMLALSHARVHMAERLSGGERGGERETVVNE